MWKTDGISCDKLTGKKDTTIAHKKARYGEQAFC